MANNNGQVDNSNNDQEEEQKGLLHNYWPPLNVPRDPESGSWRNRKVAHVFYAILILVFLLLTGITIHKEYFSKEDQKEWISTFVKDEEIPFPTITICGNYYTGRSYEFGNIDCSFVPYTDDDTTTCPMKTQGIVLDEEYLYPDYLKDPCVVFNPVNYQDKIDRMITDRDRSLTMDIVLEMNLSDFEGLDDDDDCPLFVKETDNGEIVKMTPRTFVLMMAEFDPTSTPAEIQDYTYVEIATGMYTEMEISATRKEQGKKEQNENYQFAFDSFSSVPLDGDSPGAENLEKTVNYIHIKVSEKDLLVLKVQTPNVVVTIGALIGIFGAAAAYFNWVFVEQPDGRPTLHPIWSQSLRSSTQETARDSRFLTGGRETSGFMVPFKDTVGIMSILQDEEDLEKTNGLEDSEKEFMKTLEKKSKKRSASQKTSSTEELVEERDSIEMEAIPETQSSSKKKKKKKSKKQSSTRKKKERDNSQEEDPV